MDGAWVRARAWEVRRLADEMRALAAAAGRAGEADWQSCAAAAFRDALASDARALAGVAADLDDVAPALEAHARALDALESTAAGAVAGLALQLGRLLP